AYPRVSGGLGVLSVHQGPGLTNAMTGITGAAKSRTPMLILAAGATAPRSNFYIGQAGLARAAGAVPERAASPSSAAAGLAREGRWRDVPYPEQAEPGGSTPAPCRSPWTTCCPPGGRSPSTRATSWGTRRCTWTCPARRLRPHPGLPVGRAGPGRRDRPRLRLRWRHGARAGRPCRGRRPGPRTAGPSAGRGREGDPGESCWWLAEAFRGHWPATLGPGRVTARPQGRIVGVWMLSTTTWPHQGYRPRSTTSRRTPCATGCTSRPAGT
ncbi:MAG TPA: thiamine pyrophosphate-binding protein, partial [Trebonia sp.]|nr:thiamine pyrophosphate-binding protein [Trebonia sp.]